jgi:hypothetical protein
MTEACGTVFFSTSHFFDLGARALSPPPERVRYLSVDYSRQQPQAAKRVSKDKNRLLRKPLPL